MSGALIAQLLIALGPIALELIPKLAALWGKEVLTEAEITELCLPAHKSWVQYRIEAIASLNR